MLLGEVHTWMRKDFPAVAVQMRIEHKDEVETESTGTGKGHILTVMTDLSTKGLGILALEIISTAKACDNEGRANITNWLAELDIALKWEAPFSASIQQKTPIGKVLKFTLKDDTFSRH